MEHEIDNALDCIQEWEIRINSCFDGTKDGDPFISVKMLMALNLPPEKIKRLMTSDIIEWRWGGAGGSQEPDWDYDGENEAEFKDCYTWAAAILDEPLAVELFKQAGYDSVKFLDHDDDIALGVLDPTRIRHLRTLDYKGRPIKDSDAGGALF